MPTYVFVVNTPSSDQQAGRWFEEILGQEDATISRLVTLEFVETGMLKVCRVALLLLTSMQLELFVGARDATPTTV